MLQVIILKTSKHYKGKEPCILHFLNDSTSG